MRSPAATHWGQALRWSMAPSMAAVKAASAGSATADCATVGMMWATSPTRLATTGMPQAMASSMAIGNAHTCGQCLQRRQLWPTAHHQQARALALSHSGEGFNETGDVFFGPQACYGSDSELPSIDEGQSPFLHIRIGYGHSIGDELDLIYRQPPDLGGNALQVVRDDHHGFAGPARSTRRVQARRGNWRVASAALKPSST